LLDDGYLTRDRLKWAADNAYNPQLRQAATVIFDSLKQSNEERKIETSQTPGQSVASPLPGVNVDISIEDAQNTIWPFSSPPNCKGQPMGLLVNARQLVLKDLAYAIEKAWEKRVKQAATVLMLQQLNHTVNEPPESTGPLRIVSSGRTFAERKQLQLAMWMGLLLGGICLLPIFLYIYFVMPNANHITRKLLQIEPIQRLIFLPFTYFGLSQTTSSLKAAVFIVLIVIGLFASGIIMWLYNRVINHIMDKMVKNIDRYRKGQEGETKVVEAMIANLDDKWSLYRNISLPGRKKSDLDVILVGPPGVWVLEVKNYEGEYKNTGEDWQYRAGHIWKSLRKSPSRQVQKNAGTLSNFLKADGIRQYVNSIVVWANEETPLAVENPMVAVWQYNRLPEELGNIWQNQPIEQTQQKRIESKLTKLCQR